jgi:hypothetical protein
VKCATHVRAFILTYEEKMQNGAIPMSDYKNHYTDTFAGRDTRLAFRNRVTGQTVVVDASQRQDYQSPRHPELPHVQLWEQVRIECVPEADK